MALAEIWRRGRGFPRGIHIHEPNNPTAASPAFARQVLAFGPALVDQLKGLRAAVIGAGGTGSATTLLARTGVGQLAIVDDDIVEVTNLNRLQGATQSDADAMRSKAEVVAASVAAQAGLRPVAAGSRQAAPSKT
jgi:molybdopterin/thiamine biosynthesis adenylyltransferase